MQAIYSGEGPPMFSRIFKEMILVASKDKPLPRTGEGTVTRKMALKAYDNEIEACLSAKILRRRLVGALRGSKDNTTIKVVETIPKTRCTPTPPSMSSGFKGANKGKAQIAAIIEKFGAGLSLNAPAPTSATPVKSGTSRKKVVLLTGSTANLGSEILAALLGDSAVEKMYTLNRRRRGERRCWNAIRSGLWITRLIADFG
ncbi:hypothetical protein FPV67DRAFT_1680266 [Lyophyllum atratum]|nr:hypothetical protein FPV67DRAFT_1680266 [Lyophyllum atratum]